MPADASWWSRHGENTVWSLVGAAVTAVVAAVVYWRQRRPKVLDYRVTSTGIVSAQATRLGETGGLRLYWNAELVTHPRLTTLRYVNTGKVGIAREAFIKPIEMKVQGDSHLIDAWVSDARLTTSRKNISYQ